MKHIVILKKKYYDMILNGTKTIESRFSTNKIVPYNKVNIGDILYLKEMGKDVCAKAVVSDVKFFELNPDLVEDIRIKYGKDIGAEDKRFWVSSMNKKYCTLVWVKDVEVIESFSVKRSFGNAWMIMDEE